MRYSTTVRMKDFLGLYQDGDGIGISPRYALEAVNVETPGGVLGSVARSRYNWAILTSPMTTLMHLHRRWHANENEKDVLLACGGGRLYYKLPTDIVWQPVYLSGQMAMFQQNDWSWVTYEINPPGANVPVDVLLMSNEKDGMFCFRGDTMTLSIVPTPKKFGVIARYAERIWGGGIEDDPDMLVYSAPFDPFNWSQNNQIPEDGAGDIMQPSWDGDSFTALRQFGSQLIAMKKRRIWRILGTDPGQYTFREQYGGGAMATNTIAVDGERILMLGGEGMLYYDGISVKPFDEPFARQVFARMNRNAFDRACACLYRDTYYCALPLDGAETNNAVLLYNTREKTWLLREGLTVCSFLPMDNMLLYTSDTVPGRYWEWGEDVRMAGTMVPAKWIGPWQERGDKALQGGWTVHLAVEAQAQMEIFITIRTEKKARTKRLKVLPGTKPRKLVFGGYGRRWRLEIACYDPVAWRIPGGIQVDAEIDGQ